MYSLATLGTTKAFVLKVELFCQVRSLVRQFLSVYVLCSKVGGVLAETKWRNTGGPPSRWGLHFAWGNGRADRIARLGVVSLRSLHASTYWVTYKYVHEQKINGTVATPAFVKHCEVLPRCSARHHPSTGSWRKPHPIFYWSQTGSQSWLSVTPSGNNKKVQILWHWPNATSSIRIALRSIGRLHTST